LSPPGGSSAANFASKELGGGGGNSVLYNKILINEDPEGAEIEDLEHCSQLLVKSMIIREKYMMLSQQPFPLTTAKHLNKVFTDDHKMDRRNSFYSMASGGQQQQQHEQHSSHTDETDDGMLAICLKLFPVYVLHFIQVKESPENIFFFFTIFHYQSKSSTGRTRKNRLIIIIAAFSRTLSSECFGKCPNHATNTSVTLDFCARTAALITAPCPAVLTR
jgi:hypothetical protein